jgi:hypothetical protein
MKILELDTYFVRLRLVNENWGSPPFAGLSQGNGGAK